MKTFIPSFYLCFLLCLPFSVVGCSEDNEPSGEIEINQLPGTAQFFLSNYFSGTISGEDRKNDDRAGERSVALPGCFSR